MTEDADKHDDLEDVDLDARIAARERVVMKAMYELVKRGNAQASLMDEHRLLDVAPLVPVDEIRQTGVWLHPKAFTHPGRVKLWAGFLEAAERGEQVDLLTAAGNSDDARVQAINIIRMTLYPIPARFQDYAMNIAKWAAVRDNFGNEVRADDIAGKTPDEVLELFKSRNVMLPALPTEAAAQGVADSRELAESIMAYHFGAAAETMATTSLGNLDEALGGGLRSDRPTVIAAPTGIGKTALAIQMAVWVAQQDKPVYVVNAESTRDVWSQRAASHNSRIPLTAFLNREIDVSELTEAAEALNALPIVLDDGRVNDGRANLDVHHVCERILTRHRRQPLGLVVIDYITKLTIREKFDRPDLKWGAISGIIAALCREMACPFLVLSQLTNPPDGSAPTRDNIAESRKIAHDAGAILMLWVPDQSSPDDMEIVVDKAALSEKGRRVPVRFLGEIQRFEPRTWGGVAPPSAWGGKRPRGRG